MNTNKFRVAPGEKARLHKRNPAATGGCKSKEEAKGKLDYPAVSDAQRQQLDEAKHILLAE